MVKKLVGWVLALVGVAGIAAATLPEVKEAITFLESFDNMTITIASIALVLIGLILAMKGRRTRLKKGAEVPIYQGKQIVGYRRTK